VTGGAGYSRPGHGYYGRGFYGGGYYGRGYYPFFYGSFYYNPFYSYPYYGSPYYAEPYGYYGPQAYYDATPDYYQPNGGGSRVVVVNQDYRGQPAPQATVREFSAVAPRIDGEEVYYLIAMQDQTVRMATAYWVEGSTLHYVDRRHEQHAVPLSTVDRRLSEQLNRERRVTFYLGQ
jgi:hypothetical protein